MGLLMLVDCEIQDAIRSGHLGVEPYLPELLQPNSLDVRLSGEFLLPRRLDLMDTARVQAGHMEPTTADDLELMPGQFLLGSTMERVRMPNDLVGQVEGKSSIGRLGILVHVTAGVIDSGFEGQVTLEIVNLSPWRVRLHAGMTIAQLTFARCAPVRRPYRSRYQGQTGPVESRYTGARVVRAATTDVESAR